MNQHKPKRNNSKLKIFSAGEEIKKQYLTNISCLQESKRPLSTNIPNLSDEDKKVEKQFIKFEE